MVTRRLQQLWYDWRHEYYVEELLVQHKITYYYYFISYLYVYLHIGE